MLCAFLVMKLERFSQITDLADYLENNKLIAHYCGFDITKSLPSYWTYDRFIRNIDHEVLEKVMQTQVLQLVKMGYIDTSFIGLDSTPVMANTKQNNPSLQRQINQNPIKIALWVFTPLPISITKKISNSIGATRTTCWLIALPAYQSLK